ncbi:MAG: polysaccharide pyruvyl transferase CsaB [Chthonomonadales bacterium]|nr:polysaccharide pyruvyl transferase CsaB [Chthonomonadales bacterium]
MSLPVRSTSEYRVAVSGYYGCGNAGDEAVLAGIREAFARKAGDRVRLVVFSQDPAATLQMHGLPAVERMSLSALRSTLKQSDLLLSGGGSLLQDTTSMRSLLYYLWVVRLAYAHRVPVMFYAQGLGPFRRPLSRALVRLVANRADYITVRDEPSLRLLNALGVRRPPIEQTADPAFALSPAAPEAIEALLRAENLPLDEPMIGVALRPWGGSGESPLDAYAQLLRDLHRRTGQRIVLLPMQTPGDVVFAETVVALTGDPASFPVVRHVYSPAVLLGLVARMQAVVAMRLHTLIFAARSAVPPFALSYDPKVENLMRGLDLADSLEHWRGFEPAEVSERVATLLAERPARVTALRAHTADLEGRALRNTDCALSLLEARLPRHTF